MSLNRQLVNDTHKRRLLITHDAKGWNVIEQHDSTIVRSVRRDRWQPVEREIQQFEVTADELKRRGWIEYRTPPDAVSPPSR
jgi:hypothetical protein